MTESVKQLNSAEERCREIVTVTVGRIRRRACACVAPLMEAILKAGIRVESCEDNSYDESVEIVFATSKELVKFVNIAASYDPRNGLTLYHRAFPDRGDKRPPFWDYQLLLTDDGLAPWTEDEKENHTGQTDVSICFQVVFPEADYSAVLNSFEQHNARRADIGTASPANAK